MTRHRWRSWQVAAVTLVVAACQDLGPIAPANEQVPTELSFLDTPPTIGELGLPLDAPIHIQVLDQDGEGISGVPVQWIINDGGELRFVVDTTNSLGRARAVWVLGSTLHSEHRMLVVVAGLEPLELNVEATLGGGVDVTIDTSQWGTALDTIGAILPGYVRARVTTANGGPIKGLSLLAYALGEDDAPLSAVTDDSGRVSIDWRLGSRAGPMEGRLVVQTPDSLVVVPFFAVVRPGLPKSLSAPSHPQQFNALTATAQVSYSAFDRNQNPVPYDSLTLQSLAPGVVSVDSLGLLHAVGNGTTSIIASLRNGADADTFVVTVQQVGTGVSFVVAPPDSGELGLPLPEPIGIQVVDGEGQGIAGLPVVWSVNDGGQLSAAGTATDGQGRAQAEWALSAEAGVEHRMTITVQGFPALSMDVRGTFGGAIVGWANDTDRTTPADTVESTLPGYVRARFWTAHGTPIKGLRVAFIEGDARPTQLSAVTNDSGEVITDLQLGQFAGIQAMQVLPQVSEWSGAPLVVVATAGPGRPNFLFAPSHPSQMDALMATGTVTYGAYDRHGNPVSGDSLQLRNLSPGIVSVDSTGLVRALANGVGYVVAELLNGQDADTFQVHVRQVPVALKVSTPRTALNWLNDSVPFTAELRDRLGHIIPDSIEMAGVNIDGTFDQRPGRFARAVFTGVGRIIASTPILADTVILTAQQVPAVLTVAKANDTLKLDSVRTLVTAFKDSGGSPIPRSFIQAASTDPAVAFVDANGTHATFPGSTKITYQGGALTATVNLQVEGVALVLDGNRRFSTGDVTGIAGLVLTNGRIRLSWDYRLVERGGLIMETDVGGTWRMANSVEAGDWLYVTSTVVTEPTIVNVVMMTDSMIGIAMTYGNHHFRPQFHGFPASYLETPYPFTRTAWIKRSQYGYWTWVDVGPPMIWNGIEHEVGFGAVYGPARIKTFVENFRTDTMAASYFYNLAQIPDGVEIRRDVDPVRRFLFALPGYHYITPVFPGIGYGSAYVHNTTYTDYGAYVYAAPYTIGENGRALCRRAWKQAPFPVPPINEAQLALCGSN